MATACDKVIKAIKSSIAQGKYGTSSRIETELNLAASLKVARGTVRAALKKLHDEGVLEQKAGVGYFVVPDASQKLSLSKKFAVIFGCLDNPNQCPGLFLNSIEQYASRNDWDMSFFSLNHDPKNFDMVLRKLKQHSIRKVLYWPLPEKDFSEINNRILDLLESNGIQYVTLDLCVMSGMLVRGSFVGSDNYHAMRDAVHSFYDEGIRRFGYIGPFTDITSVAQRHAGVVDEIKALGLPLEENFITITEVVPWQEQGRAVVRHWLEDKTSRLPELVFCNHDLIAVNVMDEFRIQGVKVPEDIKIVGFDDLPIASNLGLATIRQPFDEVANRAVELLLTDECSHRIVHEFLQCELIRRASCMAR